MTKASVDSPLTSSHGRTIMIFDNTLLYHKIKFHIRQLIFDKAESNTEVRLDAERKMAEDWGVSRISVNKAISELVAEGYLIRRRGKGVFIATKEQLEAKKSGIDVLALILPDTDEYFYAGISKEIETLAFDNGINIMFCLIGNNPDKEKAYLENILQKRLVKGIISAPHLSSGNSALYRKILHSGVPVVLINRIHESMSDLPHIVYDQAGGSYVGVKHLFENGKRTFLFIGDIKDGYHSFMRKQGFDKAIRELDGVKGYEIYADQVDFPDHLLKTIDSSGIDALVVYNDHIAIKVMNAIVNCGYKVPYDIGMISFDNSQLAKIALVPLTSVKFHKKELAEKAFEVINRIIRSEEGELRHLIPVSLEVRNSSNMPAME